MVKDLPVVPNLEITVDIISCMPSPTTQYKERKICETECNPAGLYDQTAVRMPLSMSGAGSYRRLRETQVPFQWAYWVGMIKVGARGSGGPKNPPLH